MPIASDASFTFRNQPVTALPFTSLLSMAVMATLWSGTLEVPLATTSVGNEMVKFGIVFFAQYGAASQGMSPALRATFRAGSFGSA